MQVKIDQVQLSTCLCSIINHHHAISCCSTLSSKLVDNFKVFIANDISHKTCHSVPKGFVNERYHVKLFTINDAVEQCFDRWVHGLFVCYVL